MESFSASVSVRFWVWFEIDGPTGGEQKSEVVKGVTAGRTRVSLVIVSINVTLFIPHDKPEKL